VETRHSGHRETPQIAKMAIKHEPVRAKQSIENSAASWSTLNWSGTSITGGSTESIEAVAATFIVPTPRVPFGTCDQTYYFSSYWPGIDGNVSDDVLQGGVEIVAICNNGITSGYTIPWVEWYPSYSVGVGAPTLNPGDLVFVEVWDTSPTQGYVFFYNYSTDSSAEYSVTAPPGTVALGVSVEWIVERPTIGNVLANLTNYVGSPWSEGVAWNYANPNPTVYWIGANPTVGTIENITMVDDSNQPISSATIEGPYFLWFENSGSSCGANQQPC
jgi:Peptidase A4 family